MDLQKLFLIWDFAITIALYRSIKTNEDLSFRQAKTQKVYQSSLSENEEAKK